MAVQGVADLILAMPAGNHRLWLKLYLAPGLGPATVSKLLTEMGSRSLASLSESELEASKLVRVHRALHDPRLDPGVDEILNDLVEGPGVRLVTPDDLDYPQRLRTFYATPPVLFVRGRMDPQQPAVAVVGSRKPGRHRVELTREWCAEWAERGTSVVSGMAEGIDQAAHTGALAGGGHTVAVLGTGPDKTYPSPHAALQDRILASGGAVVSQFAPHSETFRGSFPVRNVTMAGLADAVVIMQAGVKSGALYTAKAASKAKRPVLVAPSDLADPSNAGGLRLLRDKARAIGSPDDLLAVLSQKTRPRPRAALQLPEDLVPVHAALDFTGQSLDELLRKLHLPAAVVLDRLLALELAGAVVRQPGPRYVRIR